MCGRYALFASEAEIIAHFHLQRGLSMKPRYNLAPTQTIPFIAQWGKWVEFGRWGFIPAWAKNDPQTLPAGHMNARKESLSIKPSFKAAFKSQRCLIPASGYFEWRTVGNKKQPYFFYLKNQPLFAFAGLWSRWQAGSDLITCTIITTTAHENLQKMHDRMPVILTPEKYQRWLSKESDSTILENLLINPNSTDFGIHPVSTRMSSPKFEGFECIQAL